MDNKNLKFIIISLLVIFSFSLVGIASILNISSSDKDIAKVITVKAITEKEVVHEPEIIIEYIEVPTKPVEKIVEPKIEPKVMELQEPKAPLNTNILLLGLDKSSALTDVILVANYNSELNQIKITSIPRDTLVSLSKEDVTKIKKLGSNYIPKNGKVKINEINSYAGTKNGYIFVEKYIKEMFDINIDYHAIINLKAFSKIVDDIGGVYVDVPKGGMYYTDSSQNLKISIPEGRQLLDGKKAEGLVRFRKTYVNGDLDRIEMQKTFMKEFFNQILTKDNVKDNFLNYATTTINNVETDFSIVELSKYLDCLKNIGECKLEFETVKGTPKYINGGWFYITQ